MSPDFLEYVEGNTVVWEGSPHSAGHTPHKLKFHALDCPVNEAFDCGAAEQNDFLHKQAWYQQREGFSRTYLAYVGGMMCGYVTLTPSEIRLSRKERPETALFSRIGAMKLAQMGVDTRFAGHGIGSELVAFALIHARRIAQRAGGRFVILDAKPHLVAFYAKCGFVVNETAQAERVAEAAKSGRKDIDIAISMRFDLFRPGASEL